MLCINLSKYWTSMPQVHRKTMQIANIFDDPSEPEIRPCEDESVRDTDNTGSSSSSHVFCIQTRQSPYLDMFYAHHSVRVTIDSGATGNMICHTVIQHLDCQVTPSSQSVHQADGSSPLHVVNETCFPFTCEDHTVQLRYIRTTHTHIIRSYFAYTRMSIYVYVYVPLLCIPISFFIWSIFGDEKAIKRSLHIVKTSCRSMKAITFQVFDHANSSTVSLTLAWS